MIVFRCDASDQWGMGNLMRCRALAAALKTEGFQLAMVGPDAQLQQTGDTELFSEWIALPWQAVSVDNAKQLVEIAQQLHAVGLVIDDPRADDEFQQCLQASNIPWLQFDGTASKPLWADWVLNALPNAEQSAYDKVLRNKKAQLFLGPTYAVLRPEFKRKAKIHRQSTGTKVFMTFGGGDDRGAVAWCINSLQPLITKGLRIHIISGAANVRNASNLALIQTVAPEQIEYAIQPPAPWDIMSKCDLAVMASGTTVHEVNYFQLPMVLMSLVDNQHAPGQAWAKAVGADYLGDWRTVSSTVLLEAVEQAIQHMQVTTTPALVDGWGASRIAQALSQQLKTNTMGVAYAN